jgi:hypothetical protein
MDPQIKDALLGNIDMARAITSGILPRRAGGGTGPGYSGASSTPIFSADGTVSFVGGTGGGDAASGSGYVNADGTPYVAPSTFTAGFTPDQLEAFKKVRYFTDNPLTANQLGSDTFLDLSKFKAPDVSATSVTAPMMEAAQVGQVADVGAKGFTDYDFGRYSSPYASQVVDPVRSYFAEEADRAGASARSQARAGGALRGSGPAIMEALAREGVSRQAGMALSPLYQDMFKTSAGLIESDANRDLVAGQSNQGTQLRRELSQAELTQGASANNQQAGLRAGLANQDASLRAGLANQGAAISSAGVREAGARGFAGANAGARAGEIQGVQMLLGAGDQQQRLQQMFKEDPIKALNILNSIITGAVPSATGQTSTTTGGGNTFANIGAGLGGLGGLVGGLAALSSSKLKTDKRIAESVLRKIETLPVERWRYLPAVADAAHHIGPYAEDWAARFGGDGQTINLMDAVGVLLKGVQELAAEVRAIKASLQAPAQA